MLLKKIERGWKALLFRLLRWFLAKRGKPPRVDWSEGRRRILFLRQDRLGDAIVSTGLLKAIASLSPEVELDVLASPRNADFFRRLPYVRNVHLFDKKKPRTFPSLWRRLRKRRYEAVIDCMVTAPSMTGLLLMLSSGAPTRIGVGGRGIDWGLTDPIDPEGDHIIQLYSGFLRAFGVDPDSVEWRPEIPLTPNELAWAEKHWEAEGSGGPRILVNVSAGEARRSWPDENYVAVLDHLAAGKSNRLLVVGAPGEADRVDALARSANVRVVATPSLENIAAMVATADLLFTPDTSLVHMASAFRVTTAAMFVKGTSRQWGPFDTLSAVIESDGETLENLPLERVLATVADAQRLSDRGKAIP